MTLETFATIAVGTILAISAWIAYSFYDAIRDYFEQHEAHIRRLTLAEYRRYVADTKARRDTQWATDLYNKRTRSP